MCRSARAVSKCWCRPDEQCPNKARPSRVVLEALRVAAEKMRELMAAAGTSEDEIIADFRKLRLKQRMRKS